MDMSCFKPRPLPDPVYAVGKVAHCALRCVDEPVAGGEFPVGRNPKIARSRATRIGTMRSAMDFAQTIQQVQERISLSSNRPCLEYASARHHLFQHLDQM